MSRPSILIYGTEGRRRRWFPDEALKTITGTLGLGEHVFGMPWELLTAGDAAACLPQLRVSMLEEVRFISMIESIAEGRSPTACVVCQTRFYPLRSDARYCSARCRTRAKRNRQRAAQ